MSGNRITIGKKTDVPKVTKPAKKVLKAGDAGPDSTKEVGQEELEEAMAKEVREKLKRVYKHQVRSMELRDDRKY